MRVLILGGLLVAFGALVGGLYWYNKNVQPVSSEVIEQYFLVHPGRSLSSIAVQLEEKELVRSADAFKLLAQITGQAGKIKMGEYLLSPSMSALDVLKILTSGKSAAHVVTFKEGLHIVEVAQILEDRGLTTKSEFLAVARDRQFVRELLQQELSSFEGYLFPETYSFTRFMGAKQIIKTMVEHFQANAKEVMAGSNKLSMPLHEWVTLSSIIEKETGAPEERGLVSSVFHNRLKKGMLLQTDPTVLYGIFDQTGVMPNNIRKIDLLTPNRYNTYRKRGLPYGPISNPGRASLQAALNPEDSQFLFFVSRNDGTHVFSETYAEHNRAVKDFQLNRTAREGKSWRDLAPKREKAQSVKNP